MNFIVTGLPKCGKTLLTHTLNLLNDFNVFGEVLIARKGAGKMPPHPHQVMESIRQRDLENNFLTWYNWKHQADHDNILDIYKPWDVDNYLDIVFSHGIHSGFKVHHHHLQSQPLWTATLYLLLQRSGPPRCDGQSCSPGRVHPGRHRG